MEPVTREEFFFNAIAEGETSGLLAPVTRSEVFLNAIATGSADVPQPITREEIFLAARAAGSGDLPESATRREIFLKGFALGQADDLPDPITRDEFFIKAAANGGGGVPGDLETSGWVLELGANTTVVGNVITLAVGDYSHHCYLAPPESVRAGRTFEAGDVLIMAVKITDVFQKLQAGANSFTVGAMTSATGLFTGNGTTMNRKASETGSDVLTWTFTKQATGGARLTPLPSDKTSYATCEITGLSFNGNLIFGKV